MNEEALTVLCSAVKYTGSVYSMKEVCRRKHETPSRVFLPTSWVFYPLPACFTTEQSIVKVSLFVLW